MQTTNFSNLSEFLSNWKSNKDYFRMLSLMASLSKLFSESDTPYLDYRLAENLFCKYFNAINDARSCTAYDARLNGLGIGIKTFILRRGTSIEKIAEFNKLRNELAPLSGYDLARKLAEFRNSRMEFANNAFNVTESQYHIVGRDTGVLRVFNVEYEKIEIDRIKSVKDNGASLHFEDGKNEYTFNRSKSVLLKRFNLPSSFVDVKVNILDDPIKALEDLLDSNITPIKQYAQLPQKGIDYVILPLYSTISHQVPKKSGLNQWNAGGRKRNDNELYIPVPAMIHKNWPSFFPKRDEPFSLQLPDGKVLSAKICQENGKALMSNPNSDLGEWILRKVLKKKAGDIVTMTDLNQFGIDSIMITNNHQIDANGCKMFSLTFTNAMYESYDEFIE